MSSRLFGGRDLVNTSAQWHIKVLCDKIQGSKEKFLRFLFVNFDRVATAQGKPGIWKSIFPDRENAGNLPKNIKNMFLHREFNSNTGKIWR